MVDSWLVEGQGSVIERRTPQVKRNLCPSLVLDSGRESLISSSGALLLRDAVRASCPDRALSQVVAPWRSPRSVHDPGKVLIDLAIAVGRGGDCAADVAVVRAQPALFGPVASDPTVSRLVTTLASDVENVLPAIRAARARRG